MSVAWEQRRLELFERGTEVNLLDWGGSGPPALLSHANGFCAGTWDPVAQRLDQIGELLLRYGMEAYST